MSFKNSYFLKKFAPFAILTIGGFYGMVEFRKLDYQFFKGKTTIYKEDLQRFGISEKDYQAKTTVSLKDEYEKMMETIDLDHWENVRGPRPWEDNSEFHNKMKQKVQDRQKKLDEAKQREAERKSEK